METTLIGGPLDGHIHIVQTAEPRAVLHFRFWHMLDPEIPCLKRGSTILPALIVRPHVGGAFEIQYFLHNDGRYRAWPERQEQLQPA